MFRRRLSGGARLPCRSHGGDQMDQPTKKEIENRAFEIWERHGRPEGREAEFWRLAEQELRNEDKSSPVRTPDTLWRIAEHCRKQF
jgi:hypothetical protein